jgi:hypothetical protein
MLPDLKYGSAVVRGELDGSCSRDPWPSNSATSSGCILARRTGQLQGRLSIPSLEAVSGGYQMPRPNRVSLLMAIAEIYVGTYQNVLG